MKRKKYGRTDLVVSELCVGTGRLGSLADRASAYSVLNTYVELGGNFIQSSSHAYLPSLECEAAVSYSLVGAWLKSNPALRERLVLSCRIRCPKGVCGLELEKSIRAQVEAALKRIGTRYLDIALVDWSAGYLPTYEVMAVLERLSNAGLVRYAGSIGFPCWRIAEWLGRGAQPSKIRLESAHLDGPFTQCCLEELAREHRVSLVARWPYPSGYQPLFRAAREVFGRTSFQVGMAWLFSRASLCAVQFSPKQVWELEEAMAAAECELSDDDLSKVEEAYSGCALPPYCPRIGNTEAAVQFRPFAPRPIRAAEILMNGP